MNTFSSDRVTCVSHLIFVFVQNGETEGSVCLVYQGRVIEMKEIYIVVTALEIYLIIINIITFFAYGIDKKRAIRSEWRISEKTLLGLAFVGGSAGALLGMMAFRHKTKHLKFQILVPLFLMLQIVVFRFVALQ